MQLINVKHKKGKVLIKERENGSKRVQFKCSDEIKTDQSDKNSCDINVIMENYAKTGLLPQSKETIAQYIDNTNIPSLEEAHELISGAYSMFMELPSKIRKMMDNDPTKLVDFLNDKSNRFILEEYGVLNKKVEAQQEVVLDPSATAKTQEVSGKIE